MTFPGSTGEAELRAYLAPLADKHNAARVINEDGGEIQMRKGRHTPDWRPPYSYRSQTS